MHAGILGENKASRLAETVNGLQANSAKVLSQNSLPRKFDHLIIQFEISSLQESL